MKMQTLTPALAVLSLRAKVRGRRPHIQGLDWYVLHCIETGAFSNLKPEDFERARRVRRENNRRAARWEKNPPKDKKEFLASLTNELDSFFGIRSEVPRA